MPKEVVHGDRNYGPPEVAGEPVVLPVVVVGWSRETGDVQIVTRDLHAEVPTPEEQREGIPPRYGYYVTMDRRGINDLIRHLRRARDAAFGRDE